MFAVYKYPYSVSKIGESFFFTRKFDLFHKKGFVKEYKQQIRMFIYANDIKNYIAII